MDMNQIILASATFIIEEFQVIFYSDSEEDEYEILEKVDGYAEYTVPNMNDNQFKLHFRMSPTTFEDLLRRLHFRQAQNVRVRGHPSISLDKQAMILIWCLGNMESFRSVADRFGISKSTCWSVLYRTCRLLLEVNNHFQIISWPTGNRAINTIRNFEGHQGHHLPGVIGAIDGSHIRIVAPKNNHNSYINRKSYHSVLLQGVCDSKMVFTDVYCGEVGSIHDYTMFKRSDLYERIRNNTVSFPNDSYLIGDLAYKLEEYMLVGFKNYGNLTRRQKNFNFILSRSRVVIENAFALLKGRFRRLKFLETVRLDLISLLIVSACILHNICLLEGDLIENIVYIEEEVQEQIANNPLNNLDIVIDRPNANAVIKRNNIVNNLPLVIE